MRGRDDRTEGLFSYVSCERRVPADHPLRAILPLVDAALAALSGEFEKLYALNGRPSIPPEKLLRALLLQAFYSVRSERQLMEQLDYNLLFRWFVGLGVDDPVWDVTVFTQRTATVSWKARSRPSSWMRCWISHGSRRCSRMSTSRSTAR